MTIATEDLAMTPRTTMIRRILFAVALFVVGIAHTFNYNRDYFIPADEVARVEGARPALGVPTGA